ncbi:MAG: Kae1-associated serine/threonine protein kinase [Nanoarchaeota archaeon]|nr:Kae1-associated serine/threonine protein kinase [Nanoarchaeota archaeon]
MNILKRGAEAILYKEDDQLVKERISKGYRISEIDNPLRKSRTKGEARLLSEARRAGVNAPKVFETDEFKIKMEFIDGIRIKELFSKKADLKIAEEIGKSVGLLHKNKIVHGDLTTSNMILKDDIVYFIDFGLGSQTQRIEDFATDLSVFKEAIKSTHFKDMESIWGSFIKGYKQTNTKSQEVLNILEKIEKRGRYIKR